MAIWKVRTCGCMLVSTWFWWSCWWWAGLHRQADAVSIGGSVESTLASFHHPFLEILTPVNGQVAETTEVDIELVVREFTMPSSFRGAKICLGIHAKNAVPTSNGDTETGLTEFCFDQTSSKVFHAQNLVAGKSYTVRVFLVDRGNVIAVSMRHFRVAAIAIPGHAGLVTILTALQHAVTLHDTDAAVGIYRRILAESPEHSHTLHLLGLTKLRAGRAMEAIPYLQQALRANATIEALHNTLGLCLKEVGRPEDAAWHFEKALALRPSYVEARFNLGTLWQATQVYDRAIDEFRTLAAMVQAHSLDLTAAHQRDVFVRLCGAYQGAARRDDALGCLNDALALWPHDTDFINERGNWYLNAGYLDLAHDDYQVAADAGALVATFNLALVKEAMGHTNDSINVYANLLQLTETRHLSTSHIRMVQAGVVPRVLPFDSALVDQAREDMGRRLDAMLQQDSITTVDWTDLMTNQFPTGYHLISHPHNNNQLKQKLATMLEMYAPSLKAPSFLGRSYWTIPRELRHRSRIGFVAEDSHVLDLVHALDQSTFDVFLFTVSSSAAANVARQLGLRHVHFVALPAGVGPSAVEIQRHDLDVLIYADVGANKWSYFLSFAKLAPVQAVWALGHSDTSGVRAIDYVVTSEYEYPDFDRQHYSETPFALKGLGLYQTQSMAPNTTTYPLTSRAHIRQLLVQEFHLPKSFHFYFVAEPVDHLHVDMDAVVRRILKRDPLGHMFFLASLSHWNAAFADRMTLQPGLPIDRVHLIDSSEVPMAALLRACDVHLANLYTNAFQHTLEAVAAGVPTVTLPGQLWRTRVPFGVLRHINAVATVATSAADYVRLAVRAAGDQPFRDAVVATLHSNGPKLFGDDTAVIEWTRFLHFALDQARRVRQETPVM